MDSISRNDLKVDASLLQGLATIFKLPRSHWALMLSMVGFLILVSFYNFLLFHTLIEFYAILVAILLSIVVWQIYPLSKNHFLM